jgi:hypothetical protein
MLKWLVVIVLGVVLLSGLRPMLTRFGLGRLPGDLNVRWRGRSYSLPIASTIVVSGLLTLLARLL